MTKLRKTHTTILSLIAHVLPDSIYYPKFIKIKITHSVDPLFLPPPIQLNASQNLLIINSILRFQNYHLTSKTPHTSFKNLTAYYNYLMVVSWLHWMYSTCTPVYPTKKEFTPVEKLSNHVPTLALKPNPYVT